MLFAMFDRSMASRLFGEVKLLACGWQCFDALYLQLSK